ncbi:hypothetical protein [uncultured Microbacterium sp.]|uniref:hypothetical protein n=1 Tax=uncultured Microbacterium sp. TaxID=191216 RepID=UPI00260B12C4|nr:hypothetical protein [uncultured Microbacterium sp.]
MPPSAERFREAIEAALAEWFGNATADATVLHGGLSGALVLRLGLSGLPSGDVRPGEYILKVRPRDDESETSTHAHDRVADVAPEFAAAHMPVIAREFRFDDEESSVEIALLSIAGGSLRRYAPCARPASPVLERHVSLIVQEFTEAWSDTNKVETLTVEQSLRKFVGDARFDDAIVKSDSAFPESGLIYTPRGLLLSPTKFLELVRPIDEPAPVLVAVNHRDLHGGNILIDSDAEAADFYIIDFDESATGLSGYDSAYLEVERFFRNCEGADSSSVRGLATKQPRLRERDDLSAAASAFLRMRDEIRDGEERVWRGGGWEDVLRRQSVLARIAAALTWLRRKSISRPVRDLLAHYAGAQCADFVETYHPNALAAIQEAPHPPSPALEQLVVPASWGEVRARLGRLDGVDRRLILIAERDENPELLAGLGQVPWQAVIDLDPMSAESGLFSVAAENIESGRGVHRFSRSIPSAITPRSCGWMFANGWPAVGEQLPTDREWQYSLLPIIRNFASQLHSNIGDTSVTVLVLGGVQAGLNESRAHGIDKINHVVSAIDEAFAGRVDFVCCGVAPRSDLADVSVYDISQADVAQMLATELGLSSSVARVEVPGPDGPVEIPASLASTLSESFEVVHRRIGESDPDAADSGFVRGGLVSWADLKDAIDVPRDLYSSVIASLEEALDSRRTRTVILSHNPGAGGSTLARRVAWDLRLSHPVCVVHHDALLTAAGVLTLADRLKAMYERAERPVLCVVESSSLSESGREQLYRLLSTSGTRVVLLYVRRVFSGTRDDNLCLLDPMSTDEVDRFVSLYTPFVTTDRLAEIGKLAHADYERYRSPFFFGLTAFERDFKSLESYVANHVSGVLGRRRDVLEYLAFVTSFSEVGLDLSTVHRLLGYEPGHGLLPLADLFGDTVERLLVQHSGKIKVVHPILAEEVLDELVGGGRVPWRNHAHELALEFIRDLGTLTETTSVSTMDLLRQIFIERPGTRFDDVEDRDAFAPLIELLDDRDAAVGHKVLAALTQYFPADPHFWMHLGRHQIYRMNRDIEEAVSFVERAVALSPTDPIHHHALGQVNRYLMKQVARQNRKQDAEQILEAIEGSHRAAVDAFTESRRLAPDNIYGYITHMQTTIEAAKALASASRVATISELGGSRVQPWVQENLGLVSELADAAATLYRTLDDRDDYLRRCLADLQKLYGDLDRAIELWEVTADSNGSTAFGRRALAHAYLARAERHWSRLTQAELDRILDLMRRNIRAPRATDEDFRLWFEAFRQSVDFDINDALVNLAVWKGGAHGWRPSFYASVLAFVLWFSGRSATLTDYDEAIAQSRSLAIGRTRDSILWLASGPEACPLESTNELGGWNSDARFWSETQGLRRVNGVIDQTIAGPQAGSIVIDGILRVFFVPRAGGFNRNADEGKEVNFFLAFTPEGPRAWDVMLGHLPGAFRRRVGDAKEIEWTARAATPSPERPNSGQPRIAAFVDQLVRARRDSGLRTTTAETLMDRVEAIFGARMAKDELAAIVQSAASLQWIGDGVEAVQDTMTDDVALHYGEVVDANHQIAVIRDVRRTQRVRTSAFDHAKVPFLVQFERSADGDVKPASVKPLPHDTAVFDGRVIAMNRLLRELGTYGLIRIDQSGGSVRIATLGTEFAERFVGPGTLLGATSSATIADLVAKTPGLAISGSHVVRASVAVEPSKRSEPPKKITSAKSAAATAPVASVLAEKARGRKIDRIPLVLAGQFLSEALGPERYKGWRGSAPLAERLSSEPGLHVTTDGVGDTWVTIDARRKRQDSAAADSRAWSAVRGLIDRRRGAGVPSIEAGGAIASELGSAEYRVWLGGVPLTTKLQKSGMFRLRKDGDELLVVAAKERSRDTSTPKSRLAAPRSTAEDEAAVSALIAYAVAQGLDSLPLTTVGTVLLEALGAERYGAWKGKSLLHRISKTAQLIVSEGPGGQPQVKIET